MTTNDEELLNAYRSMVEGIARSTVRSSAAIDVTDLCQVGELAVLRAVRTYDPSCGTKITNFIRRIVKQAIYNEAARFLGVFTVDHKTTEIAAKVNKLCNEGKTDEEIVIILNKSFIRNFNVDHVRDLRLAYSRRYIKSVCNDERTIEDVRSFEDLLSEVPKNENEIFILQNRILGNMRADSVAGALGISRGTVYRIEQKLTKRIEEAIQNG
jgi:RNA polymerase sigma factor (sigma-70 family)